MKNNGDVQNLILNDQDLYLNGVIGDDVKAEDFIWMLVDAGDKPLTIHVNSPGGVVFEAITMFNAIRNRKPETTIQVDGLAASAASIIAMAGSRTVMAENAMLMIHNPWLMMLGDANDMRREADRLDKIRDLIIDIYAKKTGLETSKIIQMMDATTWLTASEALEMGLADEVLDLISNDDIFNNINLEILKDVPEQVKVLCQAKGTDIQGELSTMTVNNNENHSLPNDDNTPGVGGNPNAASILRAINRVRGKFEAADLDALALELVEDPKATVADANARIVDLWAHQEPQGGPAINATTSIVIQSDERDRFRQGATEALEAKAGFRARDPKNEFNGFSLTEIARHSLELSGTKTRGMDQMTYVGHSFAPVHGSHSTSDFTAILGNVADKSMLKGYEEAGETFQRWTSVGSTSDFKILDRVDLNTFPGLDKVDEGVEYSYGTLTDRKATVQVATYGKKFAITRQAIVNDDLSVFTQLPRKMGRAAGRTVGNLVYAVLTSNAKAPDGTALFHANHKNIGTAGALAITTLDDARTKMATQKDATGSVLNIRPKFLLVPVALESSAKALVASEFDPAHTQRVPNPVRGQFEVISDARLDADSVTQFYVVADPNLFDTVEVTYLNGVQTPVLEQRPGWDVDGVEFKVRLDAGVNLLDYVGFIRNAGQ